MSTRDAHLAELRCHCDGSADGHELGSDECTSEVEVKAAPIRTSWCSRDHECRAPCPSCHGPARGTCPTCEKRVKVVRVETRDSWDAHKVRLADENDYAFIVRRDQLKARIKEQPRGPLLQVQPAIAPHRHAGRDCPGAGRVPAETRYTPGRELAAWVKANGDESVA